MGHFQGSAVNKIIKNTKKMWKLSTMFSKKKSIFFALKKLKKAPSKVAQKNSNPLFFLTTNSAQTVQTEEFMFQNVAY
jgi:hypothetical protein